MFAEKFLPKQVPLASGADQKPFRWLALLAAFRAWLFLAILLVTFEVWARFAYGGTFIFNPLNVKSIALFTVTPLLLGLGGTERRLDGLLEPAPVVVLKRDKAEGLLA